MAQIGYFGDPNPWGCCLYGLLLLTTTVWLALNMKKPEKESYTAPGDGEETIRGGGPSGPPLTRGGVGQPGWETGEPGGGRPDLLVKLSPPTKSQSKKALAKFILG